MSASPIGFIGDLNSSRASELKSALNLVSTEDGLAAGGLLVDSATGTTLDSDPARRYLQAGKPVGFIAPNDATLRQVQALAGHGPDGPVEFLLLRPRGDGAYDTVATALTESL